MSTKRKGDVSGVVVVYGCTVHYTTEYIVVSALAAAKVVARGVQKLTCTAWRQERSAPPHVTLIRDHPSAARPNED